MHNEIVTENPNSMARAWRALFAISISLLSGVAVALAVQVWLITPWIGLGTSQRIVDFGKLTTRPLPSGSIIAVGSSIVLEGLDGRLATVSLRKQLADKSNSLPTIYNCAITSFSILECKAVMPQLLAAKPAVIVLAIEPAKLGKIGDFVPERAYAYANAGFVQRWPKDWTRLNFPEISTASWVGLQSSTGEQLLYFRSTPLNSLSIGMRKVLQSKYRSPVSNNWSDPYEIAFDFGAKQMQVHLASTERNYREMEGEYGSAKVFEEILQMIRAAGIPYAVVLLPTQPQLQTSLATQFSVYRHLGKEITERNGGHWWDAMELLDATEYADSIHPNARGRKKYSAALGKWLGETFGTEVGNAR